MDWRELMSVYGDRLGRWRNRRVEAEADAVRVPKGHTPAAATGEGGHPPPSLPGPQRGSGMPAALVLDKFSWVCRNHILHGRCKLGAACPRDHRALPKADYQALMAAARELRPNEFKDGSEEASTRIQDKAEVPICKFLNTHRGCEWGDKCQWPHDDTPKEKKRAQAVRAARAAQSPWHKPAGGVHAQAIFDPDYPWDAWNEGRCGSSW